MLGFAIMFIYVSIVLAMAYIVRKTVQDIDSTMPEEVSNVMNTEVE
ncbi:MAG: hypothetical protein GX238_01110 [Epulopiscium sp.]|nr:hypothetical protein [Candidatus Epulonipiscium sp.]